MSLWGWSRFKRTTVAERKEQAKKKIDELTKKGQKIFPITLAGRTITKTFWGKAWCNHFDRTVTVKTGYLVDVLMSGVVR